MLTIQKTWPEKIGLIDSGIGGLSLLKSLLPYPEIHSYYYIADTAFFPYGNKTTHQLLERARLMVERLQKSDVSTIVIACHTLSATVLSTLQQEYPHITFIDMLLPTIKAAYTTSTTKQIGVIATQATIDQQIHKNYFSALYPDATLLPLATPELATLIESNAAQKTIKQYLQNHLNVFTATDTLLLGCTHYAFMYNTIQELLPKTQLISAHALLQIPATDDVMQKKIVITSSNNQTFTKTIEPFLPNTAFLLETL